MQRAESVAEFERLEAAVAKLQLFAADIGARLEKKEHESAAMACVHRARGVKCVCVCHTFLLTPQRNAGASCRSGDS